MTELENNLIHRWNVADALRRSAARSPHQRAIYFQGRELTYAEFDALTSRMARLLMAQGIQRGDKVAIFAANSPEYAAAFFACGRMGAVMVPINLLFTAEDVDYVLEKTRAKALLIDPIFHAKANSRPSICFQLDDQFRQTLAAQDGSAVEEFVTSEDPLLI